MKIPKNLFQKLPKEIYENTFVDAENSKYALVDFYADWCGPCQMLAPLLEELDKQTNIKILKIDVDELGSIAGEFRVMSIPTLIVFKEGKMVKREMGYMPLERLKSLIS